MAELTYEDDEELRPRQIPKWRIAKLPWEIEILHAAGRRRNPPLYETRQERTSVLKIVKAIMPLRSGVESIYPEEWVKNCCDWARGKWLKREPVSTLGLVHLIEDENKKTEFVRRWMQKNGKVATSFVPDNASQKTGGFLDGE